MKSFFVLLTCIFCFSNCCLYAQSFDYSGENIYVITHSDIVSVNVKTEDGLLEMKNCQLPSVSYWQIATNLYENYTKQQKGVHGTKGLYIKWLKKINKKGDTKQVVKYLCCINIDKLRKYESANDYAYNNSAIEQAMEKYCKELKKQPDNWK